MEVNLELSLFLFRITASDLDLFRVVTKSVTDPFPCIKK